MKKYSMPQAQVINFDNDYVVTTNPSPTGSSSTSGGGDIGPAVGD